MKNIMIDGGTLYNLLKEAWDEGYCSGVEHGKNISRAMRTDCLYAIQEKYPKLTVPMKGEYDDYE